MEKLKEVFKRDSSLMVRLEQPAYSLGCGSCYVAEPYGQLPLALGQRIIVDIEDRYCKYCPEALQAAGHFCQHCGTKLINKTVENQIAIIVALTPSYNEYVHAWDISVVLKEPYELQMCPNCRRKEWRPYQIPLAEELVVTETVVETLPSIKAQDVRRCSFCGWLKH